MAINAADFEHISKIVKEDSAIVLEKGKEYLVESRLMPLVHQEKLESLENLVKQLIAKPKGELHIAVIKAMTTNETSFFSVPYNRNHVFLEFRRSDPGNPKRCCWRIDQYDWW